MYLSQLYVLQLRNERIICEYLHKNVIPGIKIRMIELEMHQTIIQNTVFSEQHTFRTTTPI